MFSFFRSFRFRLFGLVGLALLPALGFILNYAYEQQKRVVVKAQDEAVRLADLNALHLEQMIGGVRQLVVALAQIAQVKDTPEFQRTDFLAKLLKQYPYYHILGIVNMDGSLDCSAPPAPPNHPMNFADRTWFKKVVQTRRFFVSDLQISRVVPGKQDMVFAYPILNPKDELLGVAGVSLSLKWLGEMAAKANLPPDAVLLVTDRYGNILARSSESSKWVGQQAPKSPLISTILQERKGVAQLAGLDGVPRLYAFLPVYRQEGPPEPDVAMYVAVGLPTAMAFAEVNRTLVGNLVVIGLITVLILILAWWGGNLLVLKPVRALAGTVAQLAAGDLSVRTNLSGGPDELTLLAGAFDSMADNLQQREAERDQAASRLAALTRLYRLRSRINEVIVRTRDPQRLYEQVVRIAVEEGGLRMAWVGEVDRETQRVMPVAQGGHVDGYLDGILISTLDIPEGRGPTGTAARENRVVFINDWEGELQMAPWSEAGIERGYRSSAAFPLRLDNRVVAVLSLCAGTPEFFTAEEVALLTALSDDLSYALAAMAQERQRQEAEKVLQETSARLEALIDSSAVAIYLLDPEGRVSLWNRTAEAIFGWRADEVLGRPLPFIPPDKKEEHLALRRRVFQEGETLVDMETVRLKKDGTPIYLSLSVSAFTDAQGRIIGAMTVVLDITARKEAEERLKNQMEFVTTLLETIPSPVFYKDASGRYLGCNQAFEEFFGKPRDQIIGKDVYDMGPPEIADTYAGMDQALFERPGRQIYEWQVRAADGSDKEVIFNKATFSDASGKVAGLIGVIQDITAHKQAEEALRQSEERLRLKLDSILSPDVDIGDQELSNIIDTPAIQAMMEDFTKLTNMVTAILDIKGNVLVATGWQDICTQYHRVHPQTGRSCTESDLFLAQHLRPGEYVAYKCKNNLWDVATPLFIGGKHVGNIYTGQFFYEDEAVDDQLFIDQAAQYGFDQEAYLAAMRRVPRLSRELVKPLMDFLTKFSELVSRQSYSNLKLAQAMLAQRRAEEEILRLASFPKLNPNPVLEVDLNGKITYGNESALEALRKLGRQDIAAFLPPDLGDLIQSYREEGKKQFSREIKIGDAVFAATIHVVDEFKTLRLFAVDITERKQAEEALRDASRNWQTTFDAIGDGVCLLDLESRIVQANQAFLDLVGKPAAEVEGRHCWELVHGSKAPIPECPLVRMWQSHSRETLELAVGDRWFLVSADPVLDEAGALTGGVHILADITERKQAEEALRQEKELSDHIINNLPGVFYLYDEQLRFVRVNRRFEEVIGYSAPEIANMSPLDFFEGPDRELVAQRIEQVFNEVEGEVEAFFVAKNGDHIPYYFTGIRIMIDGKPHLLGVGIDITARKQAEAALRESEELYRSLFENMLNGFCFCKLLFEDNQPRDFIFIEVNKAFDVQTGLKDVEGKKASEVIPGLQDANPELFATYGRVVSTGKPERFELYVKPMQKWYVISAYTPAKEHFVAVFDDITAEKQALEYLQASEERLRLAVAASDTGLWDYDLLTTRVYFSPEWKRQIGYEEHELPNLFAEWESRLHPEDHDRAVATVQAYLENPWPDYEMEFRMRHRDGSYRWILAKADLYFDQTGRPVRMMGSHLDITRRKLMEQELAEASAQLRGLAARLAEAEDAERKRLARELHDQVGQNLTVLSINLDIVKGQLPKKTMAPARSRLDTSMDLIQQTGRAIRNLMAELRPPVLDDYGIEAALRWHAGEFTAWTGIEVEVEGEELAPRLDQAVENVFFRISQEALTNVAKHARASRAVVSLEARGDTVRMVIADNGVGFDPARLSKPERGHGWGLLSMQERALAVGGRCRIESSPGEGTRVVVEVSR